MISSKNRVGLSCRAIGALIFAMLILPQAASAASATLSIPEKYSSVQAGDRLYFELDVLYPENRMRRDLTISYRVLEGGETIASGQFLKAVETQASFIDYLSVPDGAQDGLHSIEIIIADNTGAVWPAVSASFDVVSGDGGIAAYFYILLSTIILIGAILSLEIWRTRKIPE